MAKNKKKITKKTVTALKAKQVAKKGPAKKGPKPETYESYINAYRSRKRAVESAGRTMNIEYGGDVPLNKIEWEYYHNAAVDKLNNKEIINMQAYTRTSAQAKNIQKALKRAGINKYSLKDIQYGAGEEYLTIIKETYQDLVDNGWSSADAKAYIGYEYFGSPK